MEINLDLAREAHRISRGLSGVARAYLRDNGYRNINDSTLTVAVREAWKSLGLESRTRANEVVREVITEMLAKSRDSDVEKEIRGFTIEDWRKRINHAIPYINLAPNATILRLREVGIEAEQFSCRQTDWHRKFPPVSGCGQDITTYSISDMYQ
jgi:hypothetical protein